MSCCGGSCECGSGCGGARCGGRFIDSLYGHDDIHGLDYWAKKCADYLLSEPPDMMILKYHTKPVYGTLSFCEPQAFQWILEPSTDCSIFGHTVRWIMSSSGSALGSQCPESQCPDAMEGCSLVLPL
ncbi:uncharacterized protein [Triticum aestivum]|uniref:Uncharacterized protein n=1 Tax=Aegilops tauschii TaxID=37682 RepID=R7VZU6_AEGTA|nr:uncharacterized protein LOC109776981 isoform X2 [Aegilops tauschii subsp. strangulata]XP_044356237.1 uncharacterized protein LOC123077943 [Triticum aestivum]